MDLDHRLLGFAASFAALLELQAAPSLALSTHGGGAGLPRLRVTSIMARWSPRSSRAGISAQFRTVMSWRCRWRRVAEGHRHPVHLFGNYTLAIRHRHRASALSAMRSGFAGRATPRRRGPHHPHRRDDAGS